MNILMMTNTYKPILGGLERSIESFTKQLRQKGHRVIIVAPKFENMKEELDVIRVPAFQNVGSCFGHELAFEMVRPERGRQQLAEGKSLAQPAGFVGDVNLRIIAREFA